MRRGLLAAAAAMLMIAGCDGDTEDVAEPAPEQAPVEVEEDVDVDAMDPDAEVEPGAPAPDEMLDQDLFGMGFEGLWHFRETTEVAVLADADADTDALVEDLGAQDGVTAVEQVDEAQVEQRGDLDVLVPPGEPMPAVLLLSAEDHEAATGLAQLRERDEVQFALLPTCDALAGTARHGGIEQAQGLLDDAGCDQPVIIDADPDAAEPWVAAAGVADDDAICIATATSDAMMSQCTGEPADPQSPIITTAGGFVTGFTPTEVETVELEFGGDTASVAPVTVEEGAAKAYAAYLPPDGPEDVEFVEAPDIGEVTWRFLDADGEVVDEG